MVTIPGWAFKVLAPGLLLWGLYSLLVVLVRRVWSHGAKVGGRLNPRLLPADEPSNALVSIAIGGSLFLFSAPVHIGEGSLLARFFYALSALARGVLGREVWELSWAPLPIYSYGVMLGASLVVGWYVTLTLAERAGLSRDQMGDCFVVTAAAAVAGSRALYVLTNLNEFRDSETGRLLPAAMLALRSGGLVAYGGFLGGLLGSVLYLRRSALLWTWADAAVPSLASGIAVTRVGCYLYGCDFGRPFGRRAPGWLRQLGTFPRWADHKGSPAWEQHVRVGFRTDPASCLDRFHGEWREGLCHLDPTVDSSLPVHPTQLYESLVGLALFVVLTWLWRRRRFEGQIFLAFGALYGACRFCLERIRDDHERGFLWGISTSQIIGLLTGVLCAALYLWRHRFGPRARPVDLFARQPARAGT